MDLRIERTRKNIINAFIELRAKKPLERISIKELSELAFINKATFYAHYKDIYDLAEQLENEAIVSVIRSIPHPDKLRTEPKIGVSELTNAMLSQNQLFSILFSGNRAANFASKIEEALKQQIYTQFPNQKNDLEQDILLSVLIQGCFHAFSTHSKNDIEKVTAILGNIADCLVNNYRSI